MSSETSHTEYRTSDTIVSNLVHRPLKSLDTSHIPPMSSKISFLSTNPKQQKDIKHSTINLETLYSEMSTLKSAQTTYALNTDPQTARRSHTVNKDAHIGHEQRLPNGSRNSPHQTQIPKVFRNIKLSQIHQRLTF